MRASTSCTSFFALLTAILAVAGCRIKDGASEALDEESEQLLAETMITRLDKSCGSGGCHDSEAGVLYSAELVKFAKATDPIHSCLVYNYCYQDDVTVKGAKNCLNRCVLDHNLNSNDFNFGIFHATLRDGILHQLAVKADMVSQLQSLVKMPPQAPAANGPNIAAPLKNFKQLADWLTTQVEERAFRQIIDLRGRPVDDWDLPILARTSRLDAPCGETPQALLDLIDNDFKLNGVKMFGCGTDWPSDPNTCLADLEDSPWRNPDPQAVDVLTGTAVPAPELQVKVLRKLGDRSGTSYWARSSPDGRFASTGNGQIEDLAVGGATGAGRTIGVQDGSIDPGYDPTNRYYIWPGLICPITPLYDLTITEVGEAVPASKCRTANIGTYASIGAADGDRTIEVEGDNTNNYGWKEKDAKPYPGSNALILKEIDAVQLTQGTRRRFEIGDESDFLLAPSGKIIVNRGIDEDEAQIYRVRMVQDAEGQLADGEQNWYLTDNTKAATICMKGEKPMASFDNRFITFHHHANGSPQDAGANAKYSNIFVYDLLTKRYIRVTHHADGAKAYFPHFRADGWIYFEVITNPVEEDGEQTFELLATNAAIVLKNLPATPSP